MLNSLFQSLDFAGMAQAIRTAQQSVCYAAPGIHIEVANAIAEAAQRLGPELVTVCLDFDERVLRMGFGDLAAVKILREADVQISSTPGLRTGLLLVDHQGYIFTPTALYLETDRRSADAPNALRLSKEQVTEALARLSPAAKVIAIALASTAEDKDKIRLQAVEIPSVPITREQFVSIEKSLQEVPPVKFDVARQVRVFNAYLQYVELKLSGAAIQRRRLAIPKSIQKLGGSEGLEGRLKTTFELIEKGGTLSSKHLEEKLNEIRKNFTPSLGKDHGRVTLKTSKAYLDQRLSAFQDELKAHQLRVQKELQKYLDDSRKQVVDYYLPKAVKNPPDVLLGRLTEVSEEGAHTWLESELDRVFPKADALIQKMQLDIRYKDVTFETLNQQDFLVAVKEAFPQVDWDKAYTEYQAAGEKN